MRENESIESNLVMMRQQLNNLSESYDKLHEVIKSQEKDAVELQRLLKEQPAANATKNGLLQTACPNGTCPFIKQEVPPRKIDPNKKDESAGLAQSPAPANVTAAQRTAVPANASQSAVQKTATPANATQAAAQKNNAPAANATQSTAQKSSAPANATQAAVQ